MSLRSKPTKLKPEETAWTFYYDGDCGMCSAAVRWLSQFDRRSRIAWTATQAIESPPPGVTWSDLERSAYLVCAAGDIHEGFFAFRKLLTVLPALSPLGAPMWLPGAWLIGVPVYRLIADNRHKISGCKVSANQRG